MGEFDPRLTPARPDVAAKSLEGLVDADRFVDGTDYQVTAMVLPVRKTPEPGGAQETQSLFGERFTVFAEADGWGWGQAALDGYVGYVDMAGLSSPVLPATHRVTALRTYRFAEPDLKSPPLGLISMNAQLALGESSGSYRRDGRGGWVYSGHTAPILVAGGDPVTAAEAFLGAPYFWGGRESLGLDCSGLVQNAYGAIGHTVPRDADLQERFFQDPANGAVLWVQGVADDADWSTLALRRGDLIFWPGHVGVMVDPEIMLHANATHMATTKDDLRAIAGIWADDRDLMVRTIVRPEDLNS